MAAAELQEMPVKRSFPRDVSGRDIQSCQDSHHNDELLPWRTWRELGYSSLGCRSHASLFTCCCYAAFYVQNAKGLDPAMMKKRKHGAFVRNIPGIYNSTWTDMFIETTYMRMWHGHTGAIGVATDYHQMAKWARCIAECSIFQQRWTE